MKKPLAPIIALLLVFSVCGAILAACGKIPAVSPGVSGGDLSSPPPDVSPALSPPLIGDPREIAFITNGSPLEDDLFSLNTLQGAVDYANNNGISYGIYEPSGDFASLVVSITDAVNNGAKILILPGSVFGPAIAQMQDEFPDVMFLGVNVSSEDLTIGSQLIPAAKNTALITFREEDAGFLAGYAAVMNGSTQLGFIGSMPVPSVTRYGYGFIQGADAAIALLNDATNSKTTVNIRFTYANTPAANAAVQDTAKAWYGSGTEIIFAAGGNTSSGVIAAAEAASTPLVGKYIIGCNVDQSAQSERVLTSAMKQLTLAVNYSLRALYDNGGTWPEKFAGVVQNLGARDGMVGLPDIWRFKIFSLDDYEILYGKLQSGDITVDDSSDINTLPKTKYVSVTVS